MVYVLQAKGDRLPTTQSGSGKKQTDKKQVDKKQADKKPAEKKTADKKPADKKPADKKPADKKPVEKKPADKKSGNSIYYKQNKTRNHECSQDVNFCWELFFMYCGKKCKKCHMVVTK